MKLRFISELTRFVDFDAFSEPEIPGSSMSVNNDFDNEGSNSGTYTVGSKMNDDFTTNITDDEVPF